MKKHILVGIDRDGTIIKDDGYFGKKEDWKKQIDIYNGVVEGIKLLKGHELNVIIASNQSGVARGYFDCKRVEEINWEIDKRLKAEGAVVDGWHYCPFVGRDYAIEKCLPLTNPWVKEEDLRKPGIGMLKRACHDLRLNLDNSQIYFIGDQSSDVQAGLNANGKGILLLTGHGKREEDKVRRMKEQYSGRIFIAGNFLSAAKKVLEDIILKL
ncbi:HAD-IIIA family hydrolase [Candidatus Pacearchaeota archaeon]|nr:HAD-IIIA family hydrolase [Candidatus Pacearchaeota archaeon]